MGRLDLSWMLCTLDSLKLRAKRIITKDFFVEANLLCHEHLRRVASLSVLNQSHFVECVQVLFNLIPSSPFRHRTTRYGEQFYPYVLYIPLLRTKRYASLFIMRTAKQWYYMSRYVFPEYNVDKLNRHLLGKHVPL